MKFMALLYDDESTGPAPQTPEFDALIEAYGAFGAAHEKSILGGEALNPAFTAKSVQVRNGEAITTDGPFLESKEVLGGFYLLECADFDEAVKIACDIPAAKSGTIEIRPVMEIPE